MQRRRKENANNLRIIDSANLIRLKGKGTDNSPLPTFVIAAESLLLFITETHKFLRVLGTLRGSPLLHMHKTCQTGQTGP